MKQLAVCLGVLFSFLPTLGVAQDAPQPKLSVKIDTDVAYLSENLVAVVLFCDVTSMFDPDYIVGEGAYIIYDIDVLPSEFIERLGTNPKTKGRVQSFPSLSRSEDGFSGHEDEIVVQIFERIGNPPNRTFETWDQGICDLTVWGASDIPSGNDFEVEELYGKNPRDCRENRDSAPYQCIRPGSTPNLSFNFERDFEAENATIEN